MRLLFLWLDERLAGDDPLDFGQRDFRDLP
jgi:hypothetical protein